LAGRVARNITAIRRFVPFARETKPSQAREPLRRGSVLAGRPWPEGLGAFWGLAEQSQTRLVTVPAQAQISGPDSNVIQKLGPQHGTGRWWQRTSRLTGGGAEERPAKRGRGSGSFREQILGFRPVRARQPRQATSARPEPRRWKLDANAEMTNVEGPVALSCANVSSMASYDWPPYTHFFFNTVQATFRPTGTKPPSLSIASNDALAA